MHEHWKTWHCGEQCAYSKVFVSISELGNCRFFVRIVHEVDITFQNFRIEQNGFLNCIPVLLVFLILQHVHESTVIYSMHSKRSYEVPFHHPECFGQKQGVWNFHSNSVHHFTPELRRHCVCEFFVTHCKQTPSGNIRLCSGCRIPKSSDMLSGKSHCGIESNDPEVPSNFQNLLNDSFSCLWI